MQAVILAAGFGTRIRPLTLQTPKPLLKVGGKALIDWHIDRLHAIGVDEIIINTHHLSDQIRTHIQQKQGLKFILAHEHEILDTGGALLNIRRYLKEEHFVLLSADIWTEYPLDILVKSLPADADLLLVMVANPHYHSGGDYGFAEPDKQHGLLTSNSQVKFNYAGLSVVRTSLLDAFDWPEKRGNNKFPVLPFSYFIDYSIKKNSCLGSLWKGVWHNIGTIDDMRNLDRYLSIKL